MGLSVSSLLPHHSSQAPTTSTNATIPQPNPSTLPSERKYITKSHCVDVLSQASYALKLAADQVKKNTEIQDYHKAIEARFQRLEAQNSKLEARCKYLETRQKAVEARSAPHSRLESLPTELLHNIYLQHLDPASKLTWKFVSRTLYHNTLHPNGKELVTVEELEAHCTDDEWRENRERMMLIEAGTTMEIEMVKLTCSYCLQSMPLARPRRFVSTRIAECETLGFSDEEFDRSNLERACIECFHREALGREYHLRGKRRFLCRSCRSDDAYAEQDNVRNYTDWTVEMHMGYHKDRLKDIWKDCEAYEQDIDWCPVPIDLCERCVNYLEEDVEWEKARRLRQEEEARTVLHPDDARGCKDIRTYLKAGM